MGAAYMQVGRVDGSNAAGGTVEELKAQIIALALERAFLSGITELAPLVAYLNQSGPLGPNGQPWTEQTFEAEIHKLGV